MSTTSVFCIEYFKAKPDCRKKLFAALTALVEPSRSEPGCIQYDLLQDDKDNDMFILVLQYETKAVMDEHDNKSYVKHFAKNQMQQLCEKFYWHDATNLGR